MNPLTYVYNDDGTQPMASVRLGQVRGDLERWIDWVLDTPVQAYVGCTAHPEICYHNSRVGEPYGSRPGLRLTGPGPWLRREAQQELVAQGTDQLRVLAERARARGKLFLAGMRMSDAHHRWIGGVEPREHPLFPQFTLDHPEYRLKNPDGSLDVTLDYSFEAVRAHRLAILKELARDYPVDGLELDFMRFCSHFPRPASAEQIETMTGFMRSIRDILDCEAKRKGGGRMLLGVRVPPTLQECAPNGLDPEAWAREGLVDYLNPANFLWADLNIPVGDYLTALKGTGCQTLFSIQPWTASPWGEDTAPYRRAFQMEMPEFRALAANGLAAGAQGLHCFNLCCEFPGRKEEMVEALAAMSCPETIYSGPRHYQYFPSDSGETVTGANHRQTLRFTAPGIPLSYRFQMADGGRTGKIAGRVAWRVYNAVSADLWQFRLNGQVLGREGIRAEARYAGWPVRVGAELPPHMHFEVDIKDVPSLAFHNELEITAVRLEPGCEAGRYMEVLEAWAEDKP